MQNMHKTTHDRPLTGVHWPIHRGWCRGSGTKGALSTSTGGTHRGARWGAEAVVHVTTRALDRSDGMNEPTTEEDLGYRLPRVLSYLPVPCLPVMMRITINCLNAFKIRDRNLYQYGWGKC